MTDDDEPRIFTVLLSTGERISGPLYYDGSVADLAILIADTPDNPVELEVDGDRYAIFARHIVAIY